MQIRDVYYNIKCDKKLRCLSLSILIIIAGTALYSFITMPFTGDAKVFFAAANQVKYQSSQGLMAVFESWELKGIANRLLIYLLYVATDFLVGFENKIAFEYTAKFLYAVFIMLVLFFAVNLIPIRKEARFTVFYVLFFSFFTVAAIVQLQAEMTCIALSILCVGLILYGKKWSVMLAGFIGALFFFFKSIFVMLFALVLLCVGLFNECVAKRSSKKDYLISACAMIGFTFVFSLLVLLIYPQEFKDMAYASNYQTTLLSENSAVSLVTIVNQFVSGLVTSIPVIPVLLAGFVTAVYLTVSFCKKKQWFALTELISLWIVSVDLIIVSNTYFPYHYFLLVIPSAVSICLFLKDNRQNIIFVIICAVVAFFFTLICRLALDGVKQIGIINYSTVLLVAVHFVIAAFIISGVGDFKRARSGFVALLFTACMFFWMNYCSFIAPYFRNIKAAENMSATMNRTAFPNDIGDEEVLYLDAGTAAFYIDAPSYSRYFFNLPMQRWKSGKDWEAQKEEYEKLMNYSGKYIIYSGWFNLDKYPDLKKKIDTEYEKLPYELYLYGPSWNVFDLKTLDKTVTSYGNYILVRK